MSYACPLNISVETPGQEVRYGIYFGLESTQNGHVLLAGMLPSLFAVGDLSHTYFLNRS